MTTYTATQARANLFRLIERTGTEHKPVQITSKNGNAVLISEEDYSGMQETMYLLSIPGMREKILKGMQEPLSEGMSHEELWAGISSTQKKRKKTPAS